MKKSPAVIAILAFGAALDLQAQVKPLTRELARKAVREGQSASTAAGLCQSWIAARPGPNGLPEFGVTVITPYCEAAMLAFQAAQRHQPLDAEKMPIPAEDKQCIILQVRPFARPDTAFGIQRISPPAIPGVARVMLQRGEQSLTPVKSSLHDVAVAGLNGQMQTVAAGSFLFPLSALGSGNEPVKIIVLPDTGSDDGKAMAILTPDDLHKIDHGLSRS